MLLHNKERKVDSFGAAESAEFTISTRGGKAFRILIDRLYSDKIGAAVRELWTNAYDSHCAAGIPDKPFYCQLPTMFETEFAVRDYGVSMTHETVMSLYSSVFESTKDESNAEVGMFGLGSKSPFAYTDVFTVECFLDGDHRLYSAYAGEDGTPRIDLMARQTTTEPNGVRVSFPVEAKDIDTFWARAKRMARGFDVLPETNIETMFDDLKNDLVILEGDGWKIYDKANRTDFEQAKAYVRQGCVIYPLDSTSLMTKVDGASQALLSMNLVIDMPVGSVDITPDREKLSYDDTTVANIVAKLNSIGDELRDKVEKRLAQCKTYGEAVDLRNEICRSGNSYLHNRIFSRISFRGRKLRPDVGIPHGTVAGNKLRQKVMVLSRSEALYGRSSRSSSWNGRWEPYNRAVDPSSTIYYVEWSGGEHKRVTHAGRRIAEHYKKMVTADTDVANTIVWMKVTTPMDYKRMMASFGRPAADTIFNVADLPEPPKDAKTNRARSKVMCKRWTGKYWAEDIINSDDDDVIYIATQRNDYVDHRQNLSPRTLEHWIEYLVENKYIGQDAKIYQIPATYKKLLERNKDVWKNFFDIVDWCVDAEFDPRGASYRETFEKLAPADTSERKAYRLAQSIVKRGYEVGRSSALYEAVAYAKIAERAVKRYICPEQVVGMFMERNGAQAYLDAQAGVDPLFTQQDLDRVCGEALEKYPLVRHCVSPYSDSLDTMLTEHLLTYVEAVDATA